MCRTPPPWGQNCELPTSWMQFRDSKVLKRRATIWRENLMSGKIHSRMKKGDVWAKVLLKLCTWKQHFSSYDTSLIIHRLCELFFFYFFNISFTFKPYDSKTCPLPDSKSKKKKGLQFVCLPANTPLVPFCDVKEAPLSHLSQLSAHAGFSDCLSLPFYSKCVASLTEQFFWAGEPKSNISASDLANRVLLFSKKKKIYGASWIFNKSEQVGVQDKKYRYKNVL